MMNKLIILLAVLSLNGCAVYTVGSAAALATTGKSLVDHTSSLLTLNDCDAVRMIARQMHYCEVRDPSVTYNRNGI